MVDITRNESDTLFEIKGFHKVIAFRSELRIPNTHIVKAYRSEEEINKTKTIRAFGTHVPGIVKAGTFYNYKNSEYIFVDIANSSNAIIVELKDEEYKKLIIEVSNPEKTIELLNNTIHAMSSN